MLLMLLCVPAIARAVTVADIPSPRPRGWAVDLTGSLPAATLSELDRLGDEVKLRTGAELAVVVVGSTDGADARDFATRLFNTWGIGEAGKDNGILVFAALDDRAAEIVLGDGFPIDTGEGTAEAIMQTEMVPRFRDGDAAGAILGGAQACARRLLDVEAATSSSTPLTVHRPPVYEPPRPQPLASRPSATAAPDDGWSNKIIVTFGLFLFVVAVALALRSRPRRCPKCRGEMLELDEAADDAHLTAAEATKEQIGSVAYEVWVCPGCDEVTKLRQSRLFSGYADYEVANRAIPRLVRREEDRSSSYPSALSSNRGSSGGRSSGSGFGGGRSSGGGSGGSRSGGGGGHSSGRGASGRW
jgi:uncharacterized protein